MKEVIYYLATVIALPFLFAAMNPVMTNVTLKQRYIPVYNSY